MMSHVLVDLGLCSLAGGRRELLFAYPNPKPHSR